MTALRLWRFARPVIASAAKQSILSFLSLRIEMDCVVASAPLRKRVAFVAGNDGVEAPVICPTRHCERSEAIHSFFGWIASSQGLLAMTLVGRGDLPVG